MGGVAQYNRATGQKIREERKRVGISQEELAKRVGMSRQTINYLESGDIKIDDARLARIAMALGVPTDNLQVEDYAVDKLRKVAMTFRDHRRDAAAEADFAATFSPTAILDILDELDSTKSTLTALRQAISKVNTL